jgi:hypothetical protein
VRRGSFSDQALQVRPAPQPGDGADRVTYRIWMRNLDHRAVAARDVTTACAEFGGGFFGPTAFVIENDFPGACASSDNREACLNFTGQWFDSRGFRLGPAPAGGEASCLVRLRYPGGRVEPDHVALYFSDDRVALANGADAFDRGLANDAAGLGQFPASARRLVPVAPAVPWVLGVLFLVIAGIWMRLR